MPVRLAEEFHGERLAAIQEVHTPSGKHKVTTIPFLDWVLQKVMRTARQLTREEAARVLPVASSAKAVGKSDGKVREDVITRLPQTQFHAKSLRESSVQGCYRMIEPLVTNRPTNPSVTAPAYRSGRPSVRTTFQLAAEILPRDGDADTTFRQAVTTVLRWLEGRYGQALPIQAYRGEGFECDLWGHKLVESISIPELGVWTVRFTHADEPYKGRPAVAGRTWTTDVSLRKREHSIGVGVRCFCASRPECQDDITMTRPALVLDVARGVGLHQIRPLDGLPWLLQSEDDLLALRDLLIDPRRSLPLIMLTQPNQSHVDVPVREYLLDGDLLARRTLGFIHVVQMPFKLGFRWAEMVGKPWSAYLGAVRTYRPSLDFEEDLPESHPRTLLERILFWRYKELTGEDAFSEFLIDQAVTDAATKWINWTDCLFITDARTKDAELSRERLHREVISQQSASGEVAALGMRIEQMESAHAREREALGATITEWQTHAEEWSTDSVRAARDREYREEENKKLRAQIGMLRARLAEKTGQEIDATVPIPTNYDDLSEWAGTHIVGRLELHPRALRGAKNACYEDVGLVYRCLLLLANEYRNMRLGIDDGQAAYDAGVQLLGLRHARSITETRAGEQGDEYLVRYPIGSQRKQFLEFHLRKGTTKDDRYCLGIYFFWDEETQQVVVGWLPSHLDTRQT